MTHHNTNAPAACPPGSFARQKSASPAPAQQGCGQAQKLLQAMAGIRPQEGLFGPLTGAILTLRQLLRVQEQCEAAKKNIPAKQRWLGGVCGGILAAALLAAAAASTLPKRAKGHSKRREP